MINSVEEYLNRLRAELAGCAPDTIRNALADSEEHLKTALESDPDLQSVIEKYGSPEELATHYKELEDRMPPPSEPSLAASNGEGTFSSHAYRALSGLGAVLVSLGKRVLSFIWVIAGISIILISCAFILAGGGMIWVNSALTDDEGYFMSDTLHMTRNSYAIVSEHAEVELGLSWALDQGNIATFKGEVENGNPLESIFVGIARKDDLESYLRNVPYERIIDLEIENAGWEYETIPGTTRPAPPATQTFWAQSAHGYGPQILEWEPKRGTWVFVIMNEDGSGGIDANVQIGAKVPWLFGAGIGSLAGGIVGLAIGITVVILAIRRRRVSRAKPI